jgi:hypothetical protein
MGFTNILLKNVFWNKIKQYSLVCSTWSDPDPEPPIVDLSYRVSGFGPNWTRSANTAR